MRIAVSCKYGLCGHKAEDEFTVFSLGKEITDPGSGNIIGYQERRGGLVVIDTVLEKISRAKIARGMNMTKEGDRIQLRQPSPRTLESARRRRVLG